MKWSKAAHLPRDLGDHGPHGLTGFAVPEGGVGGVGHGARVIARSVRAVRVRGHRTRDHGGSDPEGRHGEDRQHGKAGYDGDHVFHLLLA